MNTITCFVNGLAIACCSSTQTDPSQVLPARISIRPAGTRFSTPYEDLQIRTWRPSDRDQAAAVIRESLKSYNIGWDPEDTDADAVRVEEAYASQRAEFWVVECTTNRQIVGTAAFRPLAWSAVDTAEIRKMYLAESVRGRGLGRFLLHALEERARQVGFTSAFVETASSLTEAVELYKREEYRPADRIDTPRCDMALIKPIRDSNGSSTLKSTADQEHVIVVDENGYFLAQTPRKKARERRLLYKGVVVLVLSNDGKRAFIQRRSMQKQNYPGALDLFVAGAVCPGESLLETAHREMAEELGLDGNQFTWSPLWEGAHIVDTGFGDRCSFAGFIARATFDISAANIRFIDGEVDEGFFMSRSQVDDADLPSPVWDFVRRLEKEGRLLGRNVVF